jgi:mannose-6-phosphate isomerase-like protein (cupin superfamily)
MRKIRWTHEANRAIMAGMNTPEQLVIGANVVRILVSSEDSEGRLAVLEYDVPAGFPGPPLHVHPDFDEHFYVVSGRLDFRLGGETVQGEAGGSLYVRGDQPHTFSNPSGDPARMLLTLSPGGFERFFREMAAAAANGFPAPEVAAELNAKHGVRLADAALV